MRFSRPVFLNTIFALLSFLFVSGCADLTVNPPVTSTASRNFAAGKADVSFTVYCVNKKLEVGSRSLSEMKDARGRNVCPHLDRKRSYPTLMAAQEAAEELGGVGTACMCER